MQSTHKPQHKVHHKGLAAITLRLPRAAFYPAYLEVTPQLWPVGCAGEPWQHPDVISVNGAKGEECRWVFSEVPEEATAGSGYLVMFTGRRRNDCGQLCSSFIGDAHVQLTSKECPVKDRCPGPQQHTQFTVKVSVLMHHTEDEDDDDDDDMPLPRVGTILPIVMEEAGFIKEKDFKPKVAVVEEKKEEAPLHPVNPERNERFLRGFCSGVFGASVPVTEWFNHVCQETRIGAMNTDPLHFTHLAVWYLRWRGISQEQFIKHPVKYAEVLQFVVGHAAWSHPYCLDECMDERTQKFRHCESFNNIRWIFAEDRAGDCEDLQAGIAAAFYALQDMSEHDPVGFSTHEPDLLRTLIDLAQQYTCFAVDSTIRTGGNGQKRHKGLHATVKLVPTISVYQMCANNRRLRRESTQNADSLPVLFLDSTHRSWTITSLDLTMNQSTILQRLCQALRGPRKDSEGDLDMRFTWPAPTEQWQNTLHHVYDLDLRYYEPRTREVYVPQQLSDKDTFGVPTVMFEGRVWDDDFRLKDVTKAFVVETEGESKENAVVAWPPVPGLRMDPQQVPEKWPVVDYLTDSIPVFLRVADAVDVIASMVGVQAAITIVQNKSPQTTQELVAQWLDLHCKDLQLQVMYTERLYCYGDTVSHIVCYVQTFDQIRARHGGDSGGFAY